MVYSSRFVLSVLLNKNVASERADGVVPIPFGSEYGIRCRNRNKDRRALVKLFVDNENISGGGFVIEADDAVDIFRRSDVDAALKFVELTSEEAELTGKNDNPDGSKGVIEARFYLEKEQPGLKFPLPKPPKRNRKLKQPQPLPLPYPYPYPVPTPTPAVPWKYVNPYQPVWIGPYTDNTLGNGGITYSMGGTTLGGGGRGMSAGVQHFNCANLGEMKCSLSAEAPPMNLETGTGLELPVTEPSVAPAVPDTRKLEEGCTVDGGITGQNFRLVSFNAEEDFVTMKLVLRGFKPEAGEKVATTSIKAKEEEYCTNCGQKKGRKADKFCGKCGHKF